jgi:hypothetical protein
VGFSTNGETHMSDLFFILGGSALLIGFAVYARALNKL